MPRLDTTSYVGPIRTSTGSISVMKISQKQMPLNGKRKYTMANADSSEMAILPTVMTMAVTKLTHIMRATGAPEPGPEPPPSSAVL